MQKKVKASNPIGTISPDEKTTQTKNPTVSRERASLSPDNLLKSPGGTEEDLGLGEDETVMTPKGKKNMQVKTKAADPLGDEPTTVGAGKPAGEPGVGSEALEEGVDFETKENEGEGSPEGGDEPYGAQVVRRLHADAAGLLHEYDSFMDNLEDPKTKKILQRKLENIVKEVEELETHFSTHERYKDLPGLEGAEIPSGMGMEEEEDEDTGLPGDLGQAPDDAMEADSETQEEPTPDDALEGMRAGVEGEEEEDDLPEDEAGLKALYHKQVKSLRAQYKSHANIQKKEEEYRKHSEEAEKEKKFLKKKLKALVDDDSEDAKSQRAYCMKRLKKIDAEASSKKTLGDKEHIPGSDKEKHDGMDTKPKLPKFAKKSQPSDDISPEKARQILEDGEANGKPLTDKQRGMFGAAASKKDLEATTPIMTKDLNDLTEEKSYLQGRLKALKAKKDLDEEDKDEKSYIVTRWKKLKEEEEKTIAKGPKGRKRANPVNKFLKAFTKSHHHNIGQAVDFLKSLTVEGKDFTDNDRFKAYHHGHDMDRAVDDVFGGGKSGEGLEALHKALITEEDVDVTHPASPSKYSPGKEPMQQWEDSESVVKGKKDLASEFGDPHIQDPSSNPQVAKLGHDHMPYDEGGHLIGHMGEKDFPEAQHQIDEVNVTHPSSNPQAGKVGKEPMQQWGEGGSLVKFFKHVADAGVFLKALAYEHAFGLKHMEEAARLVKALEVGAKSEFPGDLNFLKEEEDESEHKKKDLGGMESPLGMEDEPHEEEEDMFAPGKMGEKALTTLQGSNLDQALAINNLSQAMANLAARFN